MLTFTDDAVFTGSVFIVLKLQTIATVKGTGGGAADVLSYREAGREDRRSPPPSDRPQLGGVCRSSYPSELRPPLCGRPENQTGT